MTSFLRCERSLAKGSEGITYHRISSAAKRKLQSGGAYVFVPEPELRK